MTVRKGRRARGRTPGVWVGVLLAACAGREVPVAVPPAPPSMPAAWIIPAVPAESGAARFDVESGADVSVSVAPAVAGSSAEGSWDERAITLRATGASRGRLVFSVGAEVAAAEAGGVRLFERRMGGAGGARVLETEPIVLDGLGERVVTIRTVRHAPVGAAAPQPKASSSTVLLLATSAARAYDLPREAELIRFVSTELLAADAPLVVATYDQRVSILFDGRAGDVGGEVSRALDERGALGAADLGAALQWVGDRTRDKKADRIVIVSDGVVTAGESDPAALALAVGRFPRDARVDWIVPGGARDMLMLATLSGVQGEDGTVVSLHAPAAEWEGVLRGGAAAPPPAAFAGAPAWVAELAQTSIAPPALPPRAPGAERIGRLAASARPFDGSAVRPPTLDPMGDLEARQATHVADRADELEIETVAVVTKRQASPPADLAPGRLPPETVQGIVRRNFGRFRACYIDAVRQKPGAKGRVVVEFEVAPSGAVALARAAKSDIAHPPFVACVVRAFEALSFPESPGGALRITYPIAFGPADGAAAEPAAATGRPSRPDDFAKMPQAEPPVEPWLGSVRLVEEAALRRDPAAALSHARRAWSTEPAHPLSYVMLADALLAAGRFEDASRATGSIVDIAPHEVGALRMAAFRSLGDAPDRLIAEDWLVRALGVTPFASETARSLAALRALRGDVDSALRVLDGLLAETPRSPASRGAREVLRADISIFAAALMRRDASRRGELEAWAAQIGVTLSERPAFRASALAHETGVDLDLAIEDLTGQRASRTTPSLATGGALVASTVGAGPEAFLSDGRRAYPYEIYAVLMKREGAFAVGAIDVVEHDGRGNLKLEALPFVVQAERGKVKAGTLEGPL